MHTLEATCTAAHMLAALQYAGAMHATTARAPKHRLQDKALLSVAPQHMMCPSSLTPDLPTPGVWPAK